MDETYDDLGDEVPMIDTRCPGWIEHLEHALCNHRNVCHRLRPYDGQSWTDDGVRGQTKVAGLTMRDISDCLAIAFVHSAAPTAEESLAHYECADPECSRIRCKLERRRLSWEDIYSLDLAQMDPKAIAQNLVCEIERRMGIFPNIPKPK